MRRPRARFSRYDELGAYHWAHCDRSSRTYEPATEARYAVLADKMKGRGRALDIGCGDGYFVGLASGSCETVIGIDNEPSAITIAKQLADRSNSVFALARCDYLPFDDACFDTVVLADVIEHLKTPSDCIREVVRVLRPRGRSLLTTPQWRPDRMWDPEQHWKEYKPGELADLLGEHFRSVELTFFISSAWWQIRRRLGKAVTRNFARWFFNPFAREGTDPAHFCHMLAICEEPRL